MLGICEHDLPNKGFKSVSDLENDIQDSDSPVEIDVLEVSELDVRAHADTLDEAVEEYEDEEFDEEEAIRQAIIKRGAPPASWDQNKLTFFTAYTHEQEIKALAAGLNREEVLNYYGVTEGMLPDEDQYFFDICFIRGRMDAKHRAVKALFSQMNDSRQGTQAALSYLQRFADSFKGDADKSSAVPKAVRIEIVD